MSKHLIEKNEDWQQVRDEWIGAVEKLVEDAENWSKKQSWAVRRDMKSLTEESLGTYTVPRLLIHTIDGRLLLDPVAGRVIGAQGVVDFYALPSYDSVIIPRLDSGWKLVSPYYDGNLRPWSEQIFVETARELVQGAL